MVTNEENAKGEVKKEKEHENIDTERDAIIVNAKQSESPVIQKAFKIWEEYHQATNKEMDLFLKQIKRLWDIEADKKQVSEKDIHDKLVARIKADQKEAERVLKLVNATVDDGKGGKKRQYASYGVDITASLECYKMSFVLNHALRFLETVFDEGYESFPDLLKGNLPKEFSFEPSQIPEAGGRNSAWGNERATAIKAIVRTLYLQLSGKKSVSDLNLMDLEEGEEVDDAALKKYNTHKHYERHYMDVSPGIHAVPLPADIELEEGCTLEFHDQATPHGIAFDHNFFTWGGHRADPRYEGQTIPFKPHDCSSLMAVVNNCPQPATTADYMYQFYAYKNALGANPSFSDPGVAWSASTGKVMDSTFEVYEPKDPSKVVIGSTFCKRKYLVSTKPPAKADPDKTGAGYGGHTGVVLGTRSNGEVLLFSANRDIETGRVFPFSKGKKVLFEGLGTEEFAWNEREPTPVDAGDSTEKRYQDRPMYFKRKPGTK